MENLAVLCLGLRDGALQLSECGSDVLHERFVNFERVFNVTREQRVVSESDSFIFHRACAVNPL